MKTGQFSIFSPLEDKRKEDKSLQTFSSDPSSDFIQFQLAKQMAENFQRLIVDESSYIFRGEEGSYHFAYISTNRIIARKFKEIKEEKFVLDAGCGQGAFHNCLRKKGIQGYGISGPTRKIPPFTEIIDIHQASKLAKKFPEGFHLIVSGATFWHLVDSIKALQELYTLLKTNGLLIADFIFPDHFGLTTKEFVFAIDYMKRQGYKIALNREGTISNTDNFTIFIQKTEDTPDLIFPLRLNGTQSLNRGQRNFLRASYGITAKEIKERILQDEETIKKSMLLYLEIRETLVHKLTPHYDNIINSFTDRATFMDTQREDILKLVKQLPQIPVIEYNQIISLSRILTQKLNHLNHFFINIRVQGEWDYFRVYKPSIEELADALIFVGYQEITFYKEFKGFCRDIEKMDLPPPEITNSLLFQDPRYKAIQAWESLERIITEKDQKNSSGLFNKKSNPSSSVSHQGCDYPTLNMGSSLDP